MEQSKEKSLHLSSKDTLNHYAARLHEKYPKYSKKELYVFLNSPFNWIKLISKGITRDTDDMEMFFGSFFKMKFSQNRYRGYLYIQKRNRERWLKWKADQELK